ncbi:putative unusual protein kinase regulating ubiquinone biosynthesis (AarF/ABC1/UbiB family) [Halarchaeum rubridurum]|uniref:Membrane protein n=1 Tax=Halarchaeum rubridurum TaxID=489911 RepID=A0A830FYX7_9EURY|nr:AarF/ABC1/UbiB kinase family protein [Halarchaeum rubridurum]MBP1953450.1 putative unusual protein kinase regulating ubiquinone biosynthesis (AarF/ABC1/UbiB family) [Halarchaeum rubridurum]GGM65170.1 membrane protein [Halarchaeum rubridurum]
MPRDPGPIRRALLAGRRFVAVVVAFAPFALAYSRDRRRFLLFGKSRDVTAATRERRAAALRETLLALGPTFIKLGQLLSTRPDVLPPAYIEELTQLQDDVPPTDWADARRVLEAELGPVEEAFDDFETEAISGASLGQVYTATYEGERVAVKVRRPGVEALVDADLRVVRALFPLLVWSAPPAQQFTLSNVTTEFAETIRAEMDYEHERDVLETVRANLADDDGVVVPASVPERSTARVLTMRYVEGTKIDDVDELDAMGVDRAALAERLERCYIGMLVEDGVFHADPHPGNLAVQDDGTIVFYDFGMSGTLDAERREHLRECYLAVANDDVEGVVDTFVAMGALDPAADRQFVTDVLSLAVEHLHGERVERAQVRDLVEGFEGTLHDLPFRMPRDLALVVRVATVLEGVCLTLDPDFDFVAVVEDAVEPDVDDPRERVEAALADVGDDVSASARAALGIPQKLERALDRADRDDLTVRTDVADENDVLRRLARRVVLGVVASAGVVVTTLCYTAALTDATLAAGVTTLGTLGLLYRSFGSSGRQRAVREAGQVAQRSLENRGRR